MKFSLKLLPIILIFASCAPQLTPFTSSMYKKNKWSDFELMKIQFYLSDAIVLTRIADNSSSTTFSKGNISIEKGKKLEKVIIPRGTPGVLLFKSEDENFAISFENDNDQKFLIFGSNNQSAEYGLLPEEWKNKTPIIKYNGQVYRAAPQSITAKLLVNLKQANKIIVENKVVKGRTPIQ
jgi:hypothetical protein